VYEDRDRDQRTESPARETTPAERVERLLVERARAGDPAAYEDLVRLHQDLAFRTAFLITRSAADAEDAAQEAFFKAYLALGRFRPEAPFRPWLLRIVANEARNRIRTRVRREALAERATAEARTSAGGDAAAVASPEQHLLALERRELLRGALERLSEADRLVISYRYLLQLSEAEMAAALDCPPGTVKSRLSRALARLRDRLPEDPR
jgi:RNA polymerase sigma factor (sigma-70 family)